MELLQFLTYFVINLCHLPFNQMLTLLGYLHISFQPFFINMIAMYFIPEDFRKKISKFVYIICFICTVLILIKLYPLAWSGTCIPGVDLLCGTELCSYSGSWHLAWSIPYNGLGYSVWSIYLFAAFIIPLLYGSWRVSLFHVIFGPTLSKVLAPSPNEWPAVWCLVSVGLIIIGLFKPILKLLRVNNWYGLKFEKLFGSKKVKKKK